MRRWPILAVATLALACRTREEVHVPDHLEIVTGGRSAQIHEEGAVLALFVHDGALALTDDEIMTWVRHSVHAIVVYFGRFPVACAKIDVEPVDGSEVGEGETLAQENPPTIRLTLGAHAKARALDDDWVLVHEMVHLSTPSLPSDQLWFEEGVASYVEPIARVQGGRLSAENVVREWVRGMPQGEPQHGDLGLDRTHTWGRTYWGGALFCLIADVTIRERTSNRFGLQDALRAVLEKLGGDTGDRSLDEVIAVADAAVGVPVLHDLYAEQGRTATRVDLRELWTKLGVKGRGRGLQLDDTAPLAAARLAIFTARAAVTGGGAPAAR